ncbi:crotonase/enoyl-CoA hydratase family protein [Catellatospora vulcania]|uniref:crotonase/enoyl-CoA hydratase family protein n=1 Tax=Catellatospora vulcania TaxID=1460450 RepID=UPI0012D41115|nr:crotonase/enoyl-CoA hydratase family protein [Catellatospora vulcania]
MFVEELAVDSYVTAGVLVLVINRPEARNAVDRAVAEGISAGLDRLEGDRDLSAGVLTGAGGTFCAGMDLKAFLAEGFPFVDERGLAGLTRADRGKPLIAAVEGYAVAGGFELALACDLIVASSTAVFGLPEVTRGLVASEGGAIRLPRRVPYHVAMGMLLTGEPVDALTAQRYGLVNELTPPGGSLPAAIGLAGRIARNAPLAVAATRRIVVSAEGAATSDAFAIQDPLVRSVAASADAREGASAFAQKRPPRWSGR